MSIRFKLLSTISVCALAFVVFGAIARDTVSTTKINGPWYTKIVQGKDLVADILPPPEYIVEAHLIAYQMASETDGARLKALGDRWKSVREDYQTRHDYWATNLPAGSMKDELLNASYRPAIAFFEAVERDVIPAVQRNDREVASAVVRNTLKPLYEEHRSSIDKIVKMADEAAKKDESQVAGIIDSRTLLLTSLAFVILGAMLFCGLYMNHLSTSIIGRVGRAMAFATGIAKGDMTQSLDSGKKDEIGQLIDALTTMQTSMREMIADVAQGVGTQASASTELSGISAQMASSVQAMSQKASEIAQAAAESSTNTASVAAGMEEMTVSLTSVAGATEEMSATVLEIASNSEKARSISAAASHQAAAVSGMMQELGRAAKEIGQVTETITSISAQTNLLALNATIEAARAGAAGKGFAVVANEIKEFAQQTATATEDIKSKISGIQSSTDNAVNDIGQITGVISEVGELVNTIAAAIEEQSVASRDIASNIAQVSSGITDSNQRVAQAAAASQSIADYIGEVNGTTVELSSWGQQVQSRAFELSSLAEHLSESVQRFKLSEDGSIATRGNSQKIFAEWSSQLSVAVPSMDEQHKRFLNILNDLHVAMKGGRGASVITGTLRELSEYARYHFGEEEAVMRKHNFPDLAKHQEVHRQFVQKVNDLQDRWAGGDESVVFDTLITVRDWFINHIKHVDKKYAPYVH